MEDMMPLPVDADGEVIHIGDKVICSAYSRHGTVSGMEIGMEINTDEEDIHYYIYLNGSSFLYRPDELHHYHKPTLKDVLREFLADSEEAMLKGYDEVPDEVYAQYADKLQLKEDE